MQEIEREIRKTGIGGSDAAAIMGLSKFTSPLDVYLEKTGKAPPEDDKPALERGRDLEDVVAEKVVKRTGMQLTHNPILIEHPDHPFMIGHVDRFIPAKTRWSPENPVDPAILEIKTAAFRTDEWGEPGTSDVPVYYATQVVHYMALAGVNHAYLAVMFVLAWDLQIFHFERDLAIEKGLMDAESYFWHENVKKDIPPSPQTLRDLKRLYPVSQGGSVEAEEETIQQIARLREVKEQLKALDAEEEELGLQIKIAFADKGELVGPDGATLATYNSQKQSTFDRKGLTVAHPEIAHKFTKDGTNRVLRLKKPKA